VCYWEYCSQVFPPCSVPCRFDDSYSTPALEGSFKLGQWVRAPWDAVEDLHPAQALPVNRSGRSFPYLDLTEEYVVNCGAYTIIVVICIDGMVCLLAYLVPVP